MANIVAEILSLMQHLVLLNESPEKYALACCPYPSCGKSGLWRHGYRYRKADREDNNSTTSLNPVSILRLYCPTCKHTCSLLPKCISPFRWYLWLIQQTVMQLFLSGKSFHEISKKAPPSRWTISRLLICRLSSSGGLPLRRPRTLAAFNPASVRSRIISRSNSANALKIWKISTTTGELF